VIKYEFAPYARKKEEVIAIYFNVSFQLNFSKESLMMMHWHYPKKKDRIMETKVLEISA